MWIQTWTILTTRQGVFTDWEAASDGSGPQTEKWLTAAWGPWLWRIGCHRSAGQQSASWWPCRWTASSLCIPFGRIQFVIQTSNQESCCFWPAWSVNMGNPFVDAHRHDFAGYNSLLPRATTFAQPSPHRRWSPYLLARYGYVMQATPPPPYHQTVGTLCAVIRQSIKQHADAKPCHQPPASSPDYLFFLFLGKLQDPGRAREGGL
jgi:hypothetical protein